MSDEPGEADETARELIGGLEHGAALVVRGEFKLDYAKARDKLAAYQLGAPDRYVLLLVEAAHLLRGCTALRFEMSRQSTRAVFEGVGLDAEELRGWIDVLFAAGGDHEGDEPAARHLRGRRRLALALNAALPLAAGGVQLCASGPEGWLELRLDQAQTGELDHRPGASAPSLSVEVIHAVGLHKAWLVPDRTRAQRELLTRNACYATLPISVDGEQISHGLDGSGMLDPVEIVEDGRVIGRVGWFNDGPGPGIVMLLANGVVIETVAPATAQRHLRAIVDASELPRSLSLDRFTQGEALTRRLEAVGRAQAALVGPTPRVVESNLVKLRSSHHQQSAGVLAAAALLVALSSEAAGVVFLLAMFLPTMLGFMVAALVARRPLMIQRRGERRLARVVNQLQTNEVFSKSLLMTLELSVEGEGSEPYTVTTKAIDTGTSSPQPGERVFVRVDPKDPSRVVLDAPPEQVWPLAP